MKHTKGPWTYSVSRKNGAEFEVHNDHSHIAVVSDYGPKHNLERAEANARLMAASPDLLNVLIELTDKFNDLYLNSTCINTSFEIEKLIESADEAIKKATEDDPR